MASNPTSIPSDQPTAPLPSSFEDAMGELESIVHGMDDQKVPLDALLEYYARGRQLITFCQERIDEAQQRVDLITAGATGAQLTPFSPSDNSPTPNRPAKAAAHTTGAAPFDDDIRLS
jgi:exodeoxyribonuclease VII small subunit